MSAQYIRFIGWETYQHYKHRNPPWIKLHRSWLSDDRLFELSEADRFQIIGLFVLASQHGNLIPLKQAWLQRELGIKRPISIENLIHNGWIEVLNEEQADEYRASTTLASRMQSASTVRTNATQSRVEKSRDRVEHANPNGNGIGKGAPIPEEYLQRAKDIQQRTSEIAHQKDMKR